MYMFTIVIDDGKLMADADAGEFWAFFGGFAPLPRRATSEAENVKEDFSAKLFWYDFGKLYLFHFKISFKVHGMALHG